MNLEGFLKRNRIWYRFVDKRDTVHTADAAQATGIELHRITKNLVSVTGEGEYVVLIVSGDRRVNLKRAANALGVKNVSLMPFGRAEAISGYKPGATPSINFRTQMRVVIDSELTKYRTIYCGGGTRDRLLELLVEDVISLNEAIIADISKDD